MGSGLRPDPILYAKPPGFKIAVSAGDGPDGVVFAGTRNEGLVSDDHAGAVYRISYKAPSR